MIDERYLGYLRLRAEYHEVPSHLRSGLVAYLTERRPVGSFLTAVLSNDLLAAVQRADADSWAGLGSVMRFLIFVAPSTAWGSEANVARWLEDPQAPRPMYDDAERRAAPR
jgi:hypothetical protein